MFQSEHLLFIVEINGKWTANKRQLYFVWYGVFVSLWNACLRCRWYLFFITGNKAICFRSFLSFSGFTRKWVKVFLFWIHTLLYALYGGVSGRNTQGIYFHYFHRFTANTQQRGAVKAKETCLRYITQYLVFFSITQLKQDFLWIRRPLSAGN